MIPEEFLKQAKMKQAKIEPGSNHDLIHTLNVTKLYLASLVEDNAKL